MAFHIKQNDTAPALRATLRNGDGTAVDLTSASVDFHMRKSSDGVFDVAPAGTPVTGGATIVDAPSGVVEYQWAEGDTGEAGEFSAEFQVTHISGEVETFPNDGYLRVIVTGEIA